MSVVKSRRGTSAVQFLATAREIQTYTLRTVVKHIPKRYTFYVAQKIVDSATDAHGYVKRANSVFPTNRREAELRREFFVRAVAEYQNLISQITLAYEMFPMPDKTMTDWMALIRQEQVLLKAVMKKDRERYKALAE